MRLGGGPGGPQGGAPPPPGPPPRRQEFNPPFLAGTGVSGVQLGLGAAAVLGLAVILGAVFGIANVEITEYGLNYSLLTRKVEPRTYTSGRYWIGPANYFVKFPSTVRTIQFSDSKMQSDLAVSERNDALLRSRTSDGLDVSIELSFQYQIQAEKVFDLYLSLGPMPYFHNTYVRIAIDRLTEVATTFTATQFFTDRTQIGKDMEAQLKADFEERLFATIFSFQLRAVGLPQEFETAIQQTEVKKQDVKLASNEMNATRVSLETELMLAKRRVKVLANKADGQAKSVMLANVADIAQYLATQEKSADSYIGIKKELDDKEDDLLDYMEARVLRDHNSALETIGLSMPKAPAV